MSQIGSSHKPLINITLFQSKSNRDELWVVSVIFIRYTYSATGQKLRVVREHAPVLREIPMTGLTSMDANQTETTDYVGNFIYENNTLKRILVDGGYIEDGNYYFYVRDHLGNNRIVANREGSVFQSTEYYPFGMSFATSTQADKQPYKYNGKELDTNFDLNWYDYSARHYDGIRFTSVDPLAEMYYSISPYAYVANNPLKYIDPTGMRIDDYQLEADGNIRFIKQTSDKTDKIYASNEDGTINKSVSIEVNKNFMESKTQTDVSIDNSIYTNDQYKVSGDKEGIAIFEFVAKNSTKAEWYHGKFGNDENGVNILATSHHPGAVAGLSTLIGEMYKQGNKYREDTHSHPRAGSPVSLFLRPSGMQGTREAGGGDIHHSQYINSLADFYGQPHPQYKIYGPKLNKYVKYTSTSTKDQFK